MTSPNPTAKHSPCTHWLGACCLLLAVACGSDRFRDFVPEEIQPPPEARLQVYADTSLTMPRLRALRTDRRRLDSLIYYAEWLKNYDENAAYAYAEAAYNLATDRNWKFPRAIGAYRLAVLKERQARFGEDLEDAMVDVNISRRIFDAYEDENWKLRTDNLLGILFFRMAQQDSARYYLGRALDRVAYAGISEREKAKRKGMIMHDLALTYPLTSKKQEIYLEQSNKIYDSLGLRENWAVLQVDLGKIYIERQNFNKADSLLHLALDYSEKNGNKEVQSVALQAMGYSLALRYYHYRLDSLFYKSKELYQQRLTIDEDNPQVVYSSIGWLYRMRSFYLEGREGTVDSTLYYYKKAVELAGPAGSFSVLNEAASVITTLCEVDFVRSKCKEILGGDVLTFISQKQRIAVDTLTKHSKAAFQRTNLVEQREIQANAAQRRFSQLLISAGLFIIAVLVFLLIYQGQQRKKLEARMEALRAQINPHFISNSLNAIENLINQDKKQEAAKYLIHFSRLSRQILQRSRSPNVSLKEELRTLKHFLELEKLRFQDKLNYEIVVDEELNTEVIEVPALLLQPYVENAIWHGIKPKAEPSHLRIELRREDKYLLGIVEDDGIGRERSRELKAQSVLQQKSMGMEITEERIQGMGKVKGTQVEVIDLRNDSGEPAGTRVQIRLPLRYVK